MGFEGARCCNRVWVMLKSNRRDISHDHNDSVFQNIFSEEKGSSRNKVEVGRDEEPSKCV